MPTSRVGLGSHKYRPYLPQITIAPDLKGASYVGEFVISQAKIYLIAPNGQVSEISDTFIILG
ncbi:hypothetical protein [Kamptonema sp. UHCC 0994]|uniref:hypothetical protein n=1 Tax=Kamptonema sp. UHCC 0994 TaxID=3031329 RepID=UPI0023B8B402|nr:hypothetical protein [Kamptonema sp. UHCC 0994]